MEGSAWNCTAAYAGSQHDQQGYSPSHASASDAAGIEHVAQQGYSYTGAGQSGTGPSGHQADQADR